MRLAVFGGRAPKIADRNLPDALATVADNCKLFSTELRSWKRPLFIATPTKAPLGTVRSIFKVVFEDVDYFLNWLTDVNAVRGPIATDDPRLYWTGDGEPRMSTVSQATSVPSDLPSVFFVLGVYEQTTAATVTPVGGVGALVSRAYGSSFVTALGEEGPLSPLSAVTTGNVDASWNLSAMQTPPPNSGTVSAATHLAGIVTVTLDTNRGLREGEEITFASIGGMTDLNGKFTIVEIVGSTQVRVALNTAQTYTAGGTWDRVAPHNISTRRIYRTSTGESGLTELRFVAEQTAATTTYSDTIAETALGEVIVAQYWVMPPAKMLGLVNLANGMLAGFTPDREICFCEPFNPHAWPIAYRQVIESNIVGLGAFGNTVIAGTEGAPYRFAGVHPENMSGGKIEGYIEPCLSKSGMVSQPYGVMYPSPNGLQLVGSGSPINASEAILTKDEFADFNPTTLRAVPYRMRYFAWYDKEGGGSSGLIFDRGSEMASLIDLSYDVSATHVDDATGELFIVNANEIKQWDGDDLNNLPFDWVSKIFVLPAPINFGAAKVVAEYDQLSGSDEAAAQLAAIIALNTAILASDVTEGEVNGVAVNVQEVNGSLLQDVGDAFDARFLTFELIAKISNGNEYIWEAVHQESLITNEPFRLPEGYEASEVKVRISGNIPAFYCELGRTMKELRTR